MVRVSWFYCSPAEIETAKQKAMQLGDMIRDGPEKEELFGLLRGCCDEGMDERAEWRACINLSLCMGRIVRDPDCFKETIQ